VAIGAKGSRWNGTTKLVLEHLADPLRWTRPRLVFVNSMSDLFHESLRFEDIAAIFGVMAAASRHTFQVLTKRPLRAREFFEWAKTKGDGYDLCRIEPSELLACAWEACVGDAWGDVEPPTALDTLPTTEVFGTTWPLPNVWLGVSVEDQRTADERIPVLLELPAALRFISYEPALGPVDFSVSRDGTGDEITELDDALGPPLGGDHGIDWIIVGGESGPGARPFDVAWARSTIEQCRTAGVPVFVKQLGARPIAARHTIASLGGEVAEPLALRHRKGADPLEWPADLRVREMPEVRS
jgi:protein gp37